MTFFFLYYYHKESTDEGNVITILWNVLYMKILEEIIIIYWEIVSGGTIISLYVAAQFA